MLWAKWKNVSNNNDSKLWFKQQWPEIDFWRFYKICTLWITSEESESFDRASKLRPFFDHPLKHFQEALLPESHQSIDEHMCKFKGKSLMRQCMKNKPIKWGFKFWFRCGSKSGYLYQLDMYLGRKSKAEFGLGESVVLSPCKNLKSRYCYVFFDNFFTSPNLILKLFEDGIYATGTVRSNRKHMPTLKADKQMKRDEHDWLACDTISTTKWMDNRSVILLSTIIQVFSKKSMEEARVQKRKWRYVVLLLLVCITRTWDEKVRATK